jgi:hypothetical protein
VSFVEGPLLVPHHSHIGPAPAAAAGGCQTAGTGSDIVVELCGPADGLLSDSLADSSPVRLEIDVVVHGAAHNKAAADGSAAAAAAAGVPVGTGQHGARSYVRTPSGRLVRHTGSDAGTLLSPSGQEVWAKVSCNIVDGSMNCA